MFLLKSVFYHEKDARISHSFPRLLALYEDDTSLNNIHPTTSPDYRDEDNKGDIWKDA